MKRLLFGFTLGAIAGVTAYRKMQKSDLPEKVIDSAKEKIANV